jgi:hypothetical protein
MCGQIFLVNVSLVKIGTLALGEDRGACLRLCHFSVDMSKDIFACFGRLIPSSLRKFLFFRDHLHSWTSPLIFYIVSHLDESFYFKDRLVLG